MNVKVYTFLSWFSSYTVISSPYLVLVPIVMAEDPSLLNAHVRAPLKVQ